VVTSGSRVTNGRDLISQLLIGILCNGLQGGESRDPRMKSAGDSSSAKIKGRDCMVADD
jgi:hypothetical protein